MPNPLYLDERILRKLKTLITPLNISSVFLNLEMFLIFRILGYLCFYTLAKRVEVVCFLAAMSSSRSDVVTQFVHPSVFLSLFFLLVSLKFLLGLKSFNGVSRLFKGGFKDVSRKF